MKHNTASKYIHGYLVLVRCGRNARNSEEVRWGGGGVGKGDKLPHPSPISQFTDMHHHIILCGDTDVYNMLADISVIS